MVESLAEHKDDSTGLHIFVFCCADYKHIVNDCIESINKHVVDNVLSRNIVSNTSINVEGYNLIRDNDFWKLLDVDFRYRSLYNHNWIKQQIFKLNVDKIVSGNVLIVDAEVRFQQPIRWMINDRYNVFYRSCSQTDSNNEGGAFVQQLLNFDADPNKNFIVEATIFSTDILQEIRASLESIHKLSQLDTYQKIVIADSTSMHSLPKLFMSEYSLYGNYLMKFHPIRINKLVELSNEFYSIKCDVTSNSCGNQTKWLTFYQQIKDPSWPDCDSEEDFYKLPESIQQECVEVFGYSVKK